MITSNNIETIKKYLNEIDENKVMAKDKFLLINLNEDKTKKISEIISSNTSRKILDYLAEKEDTEQKIAKELELPISTVHYHLQKLVEGGLVVVDEFHYSKKGREVNHYKLANKYIIITPKPVSGLKQKLKGILPVAGIVLGISAVIKLVNLLTKKTQPVFASRMDAIAESAPAMAKAGVAQELPVISSQPDLALWFLIGGLASLLIYLLGSVIKEQIKK